MPVCYVISCCAFFNKQFSVKYFVLLFSLSLSSPYLQLVER